MFCDIYAGENTIVRADGPTALVVQSAIEDVEWEGHLLALQAYAKTQTKLRILVWGDPTSEMHPNAKQRSLARRMLPVEHVRLAVLTNSILVRSVLTALSWFMEGTRPFRYEQLEAALAYLEYGGGADEVRREIAAMRERLRTMMSA